jgi:SAM-dependent methyltransferase
MWLEKLRAASVVIAVLAASAMRGDAQQPASPQGFEKERTLPSRHPYVVRDVLKHCRPQPGFWVDLGAGKGQLTIPLIEATGNPVLMIDPDVEALAEGLEMARNQNLQHRLSAVVGVAEELPLPDNSIDLLTSRGSIFFWTDPVQGLREVYRVLRPGGHAYIGGGAGSEYPQWATEALIANRKASLEGEDRERWERFVDVRRPEQMRSWAQDAGIPEFDVLGQGALAQDDGQVGQGVWLRFQKESHVACQADGCSR